MEFSDLRTISASVQKQHGNLLKEWMDSGTVVPVFLWAVSPSSTLSSISVEKIHKYKSVNVKLKSRSNDYLPAFAH